MSEKLYMVSIKGILEIKKSRNDKRGYIKISYA